MSDRNTMYQDEEVARTLQNSLEIELSELRALHESHADSLKDAFSPGVVQLLRKLSSEEYFFQFPSPDELQLANPSVESAETSSSQASSSAMTTPDVWNTTRTTFKFICDEFMPAPKEQQMGKFHKFLEQVKGTASRMRLPGGASLSPDQNATLKQCVAAVKTMKEVIASKFASLQKYVEMRMEHQTSSTANVECSHLGPKLTQVHVSEAQTHVSSVIHQPPSSLPNSHRVPKRTDGSVLQSSVIHQCPNRHMNVIQPVDHAPSPNLQQSSPDITQQNVAGRTESIFRFCGPSNPNVARVIKENPINPIHFESDSALPSESQQVRPSVHGTADSPQSSSETNRGDRTVSSSPRKRPPLKRQSHVIEED